jgi:hypothetical protein
MTQSTAFQNWDPVTKWSKLLWENVGGFDWDHFLNDEKQSINTIDLFEEEVVLEFVGVPDAAFSQDSYIVNFLRPRDQMVYG